MSYGVIYKITNKENGKSYIGMTTQYMKRIGDHSLRFNPSKHTFKILAEYNSKEELEEAEKYWIWRYNSYSKGYNNNLGGRGNLKPKKKISKLIVTDDINMGKNISFSATGEFRDALDQYCKDHGGISMSSFIKDTVAERLIKEKYLAKKEVIKNE